MMAGKKNHEHSNHFDGNPMYCPDCMVEVPIASHKHGKSPDGKEIVEVFCARKHFMTRFIIDEKEPGGMKLDETAYGSKRVSYLAGS